MKMEITGAELEKRLKQSPQKYEPKIRRFFEQASMLALGNVQRETPVNTGALRSSIGYEIRGTAANMQGVVGTPQHYAPYVETGTAPHWSPLRPLREYARRKWGKSGAALEASARGLQRKIAAKGTTGAKMFEKGFNKSEPDIQKMWGSTWAEIASDL
jgi:hypothetical protein